MALQNRAPGEYLLFKLTVSRSEFVKAMLCVVLLGFAARGFDVTLASATWRALAPGFPTWALSMRQARLLFELPVWLGDEPLFEEVKAMLSRGRKESSAVWKLIDYYQPLIDDKDAGVPGGPTGLVLPAIYWERVASLLMKAGRKAEATDALYQSLQFVPTDDPRRVDLVARYRRAANSNDESEGLFVQASKGKTQDF